MTGKPAHYCTLAAILATLQRARDAGLILLGSVLLAVAIVWAL